MTNSPPLFPITNDDTAFRLTPLDLWRQWFKYWPTIAVCFVLVTLLTWGALLLQPPIYQAAAKILLQPDQQGAPSFLSGIAAFRESQIPESVDRRIETEIQILLSRSNAESVVERLGIKKNQLLQSPIDYVLALLPSRQPSPPPTATQTRDDVVALLIKGISVETLRSKTADTTSNVLEVRFNCADKELAPRALAALLHEYIRFGTQHSRELGETAYRLIDSKIHEESAQLQKLNDQMLALTIAQESRADVSLPDSGTLSARVVSTTEGGTTLDSGSSGARNGGSSSLSILKAETIAVQSKLQEAQQLYTDQSPTVRRLQEQLRALRQRLREAARTSAELNAQLQHLDRQRALALARFTELRTKLDQIELYLQINPVQAQVRLVTESPIQPEKAEKKTKILVAVLGALGGLFLGLLTAGLREYFDHRLQNADAVRRYLDLDTLGIVPRVNNVS